MDRAFAERNLFQQTTLQSWPGIPHYCASPPFGEVISPRGCSGQKYRSHWHAAATDRPLCPMRWDGPFERKCLRRPGLGFSVAEVVRTTEKVTGLSVRTEMCPRRPGDPPVLVGDSTKARELLGWIPKIPGLDQQITHAWTWFRGKMPNV